MLKNIPKMIKCLSWWIDDDGFLLKNRFMRNNLFVILIYV